MNGFTVECLMKSLSAMGRDLESQSRTPKQAFAARRRILAALAYPFSRIANATGSAVRAHSKFNQVCHAGVITITITVNGPSFLGDLFE
jgi:hypothetical protein